MANEEEVQVEAPEEESEELTPEEELPEDTTDWRAEAIKARRIAGRLRNKLTKATETKKPEPATIPRQNTGALDETQLEFFDLKGFSDPDEIEIFSKVMQKTGMSAREAVRDEWALGKVTALRQSREVKAATPSATNRSGNATNTFEAALDKYRRTNELPTDFELASKVINARLKEESVNTPPWRR